ncbi:MAG: SDR family oxidoreductase [Oscillospiraceae bacterium]|nr:SDR family oxidoreductase [Oscillospiraceae bacterium]
MAKLLEGKVAVVTGSGQGIGRALAMRFAAEGASVVTNNRGSKRTSNQQISEEMYNTIPEEKRKKLEQYYDDMTGNAETTAAAIKEKGGAASPFYADISKFDQARDLIEYAVKTYGKIDILANVAGAFGFGSICDISEETFDRVVNTKLKGYFNTMHFAAPYMVEQNWGRIINCTSRAFMGDVILHPEYCAANAGVVGLTRAAAIELYPHNITCNAFAPFARTRASVDMEAALSLSEEDKARLFTKGFVGPTVEMSPGPEGMTAFLAWLCTPAAARVSGSVFSLAANSISLHSEPEVCSSIIKYSPENWTIEELDRQLPRGIFASYTSIAEPHK